MKRDIPLAKATDTCISNKGVDIQASMQRSHTRSFKHILRQARVRRKVAIAETGKGLFLSAALSAKTKREVAQFNSHFDARVARRTPAGEKCGRAKQKGRQGTLSSLREVRLSRTGSQ